MKKYLLLTTVMILVLPGLLNCQSSLPVELIYFKHQLTVSTVKILWGTATEVKCYGFYVERYYNSKWDTVGTLVFGHGDSNVPWDYSIEDTTAIEGNTYQYRLEQLDTDRGFIYSDTIIVAFITGIVRTCNNLPVELTISPNYPNPFNPSTSIDVSISKRCVLELKVFNVIGREVLKKNYGEKSPGTYSLRFHGSSLSSGVYYYSVAAEHETKTGSMILIK